MIYCTQAPRLEIMNNNNISYDKVLKYSLLTDPSGLLKLIKLASKRSYTPPQMNCS